MLAGGLVSCEKDGCTDPLASNYDPDADTDDGSCTYPSSTTELLSMKTSSAPTIDGMVDAGWASARKLETNATVPDPGQDVFKGYVGDTYPVTMRSMYDDTYIYFLAEWEDDDEDASRQTWYFDPADKKWKQESRYPTFDGSGTQTRRPFYEDKFSMLFNVNNTTTNWNTLSCYATCHTGLSAADGKARHYTNGAGQTIDMWHWKYVRTNSHMQFDDQFQDDTYPNGRKSDNKTSGGYSDNVKEIVVTGTSDTINIPKYFIPGSTNYFWIDQEDIDAGTAKEFTAVDVNGILSYLGGMVDPNADAGYQRAGAMVGPKGIPSVYTSTFVGSRGDIEAVGTYTGTKWVLEFKRKLKTGDTDAQDIDFSGLNDYIFGLGVFDNAAIAHAIAPNLTLKFQK
jgi:hypothetical protein